MSELFGVEWLPLPRAAEMAEIDRRAQEEHGIPERLLMENAGRAIAHVVQAFFSRGRVVGAVGSGHNGGDAYIALRTLQSWGRRVLAVQAGSAPPDPVLAHCWEVPAESAGDATSAFAEAGVILDGILGTGTTGTPRERQAQVIDAINGSGRPVVAVDGPSGADYTSGQVPAACVDADVTVSLGLPKLGLLFQPARSRCGRLLVAEIGFPPVSEEQVGAAVITTAWARQRLPHRKPDAHKGDAGYLLLAVGRSGMAGAGVLAAKAALAMGAGIVRIASDAANREVYQSAVPEAIFVDIDDEAAVAEAGEWAHAVVIGPGLARDGVARERLDRVLGATGRLPALVDADGLNLFEGRVDELTALGEGRPLALTPHPGEMGRLLELTTDKVKEDPTGVARAAAQRFGAAVLLKGAPSVVALDSSPVLVSSTGSAAAAAGGSGDVLSGACGALLAAGLAPRDALAVGLFYAGRAAELGPVRGRSSLDLVGDLGAALQDPGSTTASFPFVLFDQPRRW